MRMTRSRVSACCLAASLCLPPLFALAGCNTVPVTGRTAINLVSDADVTRLSVAAFEEMKKNQRISRNARLNERLQRVGGRIAEAVFWDVPNAEWEFVVFDAPNEVNAFAMAGGKVGVFSGTFDVATTDDELAVVIAHEIGHVAARHVNEALSEQKLVSAGGVAVGVASGGTGLLTAAAINQVYQLSSGVIGLSFSRAKEREADHLGLIYMARAGYQPRAALDLWEKMDQLMAGKQVPPEWLSTHPSHTDRMVGLLDWMPEAEAVYRRAKATQP